MGPRISIICVGKLKEKFFRDAAAEYSRRLGGYCSLSIIEIPDQPVPEGASESEEILIKRTEGDRLLKHIREGDHVVALDVRGRAFSSPDMASWLGGVMVQGISRLDFIIGGSLGLSPEVLKRADMRMSFSELTFPHQLMRIILLEQIYRCFRILRNEPYHK